MSGKKILKQLKKELEGKKYTAHVFIEKIGHGLYVYDCRMPLCCSRLMFSIKDDCLILVDEYCAASKSNCRRNSCNIVIGEISVNNIINTINLFAEHGQAHNKNNPSMNELLNNRYMLIKSARNIQ